MRRLFVLALLALAPALLVGCLGEQLCTADYIYGVNVTVTDAATGAPVVGASAVIVDGAYRETLTDYSHSGFYAGAGERVGTYTLTVTAAGFAPSTPLTITVRGDDGGCHVAGQRVTVALTPQ